MASGNPGSDMAATPTPSPSVKLDVDFTGSKFEIDASLTDEERRFYLKMYPTVDMVNQRKVHCTVCRQHLGSAPISESNIKMHPILRVSHCVKCHDFYNSGEFSKGEDGSELYCRWCGQGGEVYCCSTCPYVFCKSCIVKNLSKGVIVDIEQNEHWNCFSCTSKILWPLRAQHWALMNYIQTQKRALQMLPLPDVDIRRQMLKDNSTCCRMAKSHASSMSDSMESLESNVSRRSLASSAGSAKRGSPAKSALVPAAKRAKSASNDEVVCTPDLLSMLEPDCQLSTPPKPGGSRPPAPTANLTTTPKIVTVQQNYTGLAPAIGAGGSNNSSVTKNNSNGSAPSMPPQPRTSLPPPLVMSGSGVRYRQNQPATNVVRRTVVPGPVRNNGPAYHNISGFRVDLNTAAQQESYRLPNGRLIQVKRQVPGAVPQATPVPPPLNVPEVRPGLLIRPARPTTRGQIAPPFPSNMGIYNPQTNQQQRAPQIVRIGSMNPAAAPHQQVPPANVNGAQPAMVPTGPPGPKTLSLTRHVFPDNPIGQARTQLQEQIFSAMDICTHLTGKVVSLTHSSAYNQVHNYMDLKELYIHMSYLMTYAIGRFKHLQDKCLVDMREMGFKNDANSLENGQLAAEKQASDDEDNEIEIVEPKTDTITIDSDNEDDSPIKIPDNSLIKMQTSNQKPIMTITSVTSAAPKVEPKENQVDIDVAAFSSTILASLLEVEINEFPHGDPKNVSPTQKKQPRKKTTNKPNPALLQLERKRMEEFKKSDPKLKMRVQVKLQRAEETFEVARKWVEKNKIKLASEKSANEPKAVKETGGFFKKPEAQIPGDSESDVSAATETLSTANKSIDENVKEKDQSLDEEVKDSDNATEILTETGVIEKQVIEKTGGMDIDSESGKSNKEVPPVQEAIEEKEKPEQVQEKVKTAGDEIVEAIEIYSETTAPSEAELVESVDATESLDASKVEDMAMEGIELSDTTQELIRALDSEGSLQSKDVPEDETDMDANALIGALPLETVEPPDILMREDDTERPDTPFDKDEAPCTSPGETEGAVVESSQDESPKTPQILG